MPRRSASPLDASQQHGPARADLLRASNGTILSGRGTQYQADDPHCALSIKAVFSGEASWHTPGGSFRVRPNTYLVLNEGGSYSVEIDAADEVHTFCVFFERGLMADVWQTYATRADRLLDGVPDASPVEFAETLYPADAVLGALRAVHAAASSRSIADDDILQLAEALVLQRLGCAHAASDLPFQRSSTRREVYRRLLRGREYMLGRLDGRVSVADAARAAAMSPFHFHRAFTAAFGETPHAFLVNRRLGLAAHQLRHSSRSVTEISLDVGFESLGSFSSRFRRAFGVPPRTYRTTG